MSKEQFYQLINNLRSQDNNIRKAAEAEYEGAVTSNGTMVMCALAELCEVSKDQATVMIGLILLRKLFGSMLCCYDHADAAARLAVRECMLRVVGTAAYGLQCSVAAACISALAVKINTLKETWPELWESIFQIINDPSSSSELRIISCEIMATIGPSMTEHFTKNIAPIVSGLQILFNDPSPKTKSTVFGCIINITTEDLVPQLSTLVPGMLGVIQERLNAADWDTAEVLISRIAEGISNYSSLFKGNTNQLLQGMMQVASSPEVAEGTRHMAIEAMLSYCESEPKTVRKVPSFFVSFFELLFNYVLSPTFDEEWDITASGADAEEQEGVTDFLIGCAGLDRMTSALGGRKLEGLVRRLFAENIRSDEWQRRNGALILVSFVAEGMMQVLSKDLSHIVEAVLPALRDDVKYVRSSALECLAQLSTEFSPTLQEHMHQSVVPAVVECLKDPVPAVATRAARCLDSFFDRCESDDYESVCNAKDFERYVHDVCAIVVDLLKNTQYPFLRKDCLGVLSSVISTCKEQLRPFVNDLVPVFQEVLAMDDSKDNIYMKCKAIECTTLLACGVGKVDFGPYSHHMCDYLRGLLAMGLSNDDMRLRYVLRGWTCMVECLKEDVVPYLAIVMPVLLRMMNLECEPLVQPEEIGEESDDESDEANGIETHRLIIPGKGVTKIKFHTSLIEDKELATNVVISMVTEIGTHICDQLPEIAMSAIKLLSTEAQPTLRENGALIIDAIFEIYENAPELRAELATLAFPALIDKFDEETDPEVSSAFSQAIGQCIDAAPSTVTADVVMCMNEKIMVVLKRALTERENLLEAKKSENDEDEIDRLDAEVEEMEDFISETCHLVDKLLERAADAFAPIFIKEIFPALENWIRPNESDFLVTRGIAILCGFVEFAPMHVGHFIPFITQTVVSFASSRKDEGLLQSAFYLINLLLEFQVTHNSQNTCQPFAQEVLNILQVYCVTPESRRNNYEDCSCNAISMAVTLLTSYHPLLPAESISPMLSCIINFLPVSGDELEATRVHEKVLRWVVESHPVLQTSPEAAVAIVERLRNTGKELLNETTRQQLQNM